MAVLQVHVVDCAAGDDLARPGPTAVYAAAANAAAYHPDGRAVAAANGRGKARRFEITGVATQ